MFSYCKLYNSQNYSQKDLWFLLTSNIIRYIQISKSMNFLQEGRYTLSATGECGRSLIFVKLTDSAMQSIEMYLNSKADPLLKPTIQFKEDSGEIFLPVNDRTQKYKFTLSNVKADSLQSSFQCLQRNDNSSLESLGTILKKMCICGNEDSYEKTKVKMEAVDKEQKSFCTKEIKSNRTLLGHKFKMKRPGLVVQPNRCHLIKKPEPAKFNLKNRATNSSIFQQPIRKRIIHILANKPHKKPELLLRLKKEGIADKDKKNFDAVLASVGTLKENVYSLANHVWNEVDENWEFCTKGELQLIQRRKQQRLKLANENGISGAVSESSALQKNTFSEPVSECLPLNKKRRISHNSSGVTNPVAKDNSSKCDNCNENELLPSNNSQKVPDRLPVNGNKYSVNQTHKGAVLSSKKKVPSSQKLQNSGDQPNSDKLIYNLCHDLSSKKQSVSDFKMDLLGHKKSSQWEAVVNSISFNGLQNETLNLPLTNSYSHSNVQAKRPINSTHEEKECRKYEFSNMNGHNKTTAANGASIMDLLKMISPVSSSNSSESISCCKDKNNATFLMAGSQEPYTKKQQLY